MGPKGNGEGTPSDGSAPEASTAEAQRPSGARRGTATARIGTEADAEVAASLHGIQISEGFLVLLGPGFLTRLYRRICRSPSSFLIIAEDQGNPCGFVTGSQNVKALYREFLLHDGLPGAIEAAPRLLRGWRRVIETLRHGSSDDGAGRGRGVEMLSLAVDPAHEGKGIGRLLVDAFLVEITARGETAAYLVAGGERGAVAMFQRLGFEIVDRFELHTGTESVLMQWDGAAAEASHPRPD
jgi:ribosomal protein S18 acetylase RimI-like enzyme